MLKFGIYSCRIFNMNPINMAIDMLGGPSKTASALGVTPQAVCFWRDGKRQLAAEYCPAIERATNGAVRCEDLRPDVDWAYIRGSKKKVA